MRYTVRAVLLLYSVCKDGLRRQNAIEVYGNGPSHVESAGAPAAMFSTMLMPKCSSCIVCRPPTAAASSCRSSLWLTLMCLRERKVMRPSKKRPAMRF